MKLKAPKITKIALSYSLLFFSPYLFEVYKDSIPESVNGFNQKCRQKIEMYQNK